MEVTLRINDEVYSLKETVDYPNCGKSYFYTGENDTAIIVDEDICKSSQDRSVFEYTLLTNKQNEYMSRYSTVYRIMKEDLEHIDDIFLNGTQEYSLSQNDRANLADASPLERKFEDLFIDVYGEDSAGYLWKEYGITDDKGHTKYLDYYLKTDNGDIAIEENGVSFHHPQIIGLERYREQLRKQNLCSKQGIKLYRFSTEDCQFEDRMEDDIKTYLGSDASAFHKRGLLVDRSVVLYEHQKTALADMEVQRKAGIQSFLIVFPTASGKSKIVEEDIQKFSKDRTDTKILILVPNNAIRNDWVERVNHSLKNLESDIMIQSYAYMERHYSEYAQDYFSYIVVDEAHHAVAPGLKRTIQYFTPDFLVGMTATDQRPDKKKLETIFGTYHVGLSLQEAMEKGIIAKANSYRIETNIDLSKVRINGKDYINADLEKTFRVTSRNELIVNVIQQYFTEGTAGQRQGLIFCVNTAHCAEIEKLMNAAGIPARAYTSKTKDAQQVMQDFKDHKIRFLCTCQMISEGWDYPELGILVMARPTLSKVLYLQQLGRGLRKTSTKNNVFVIDVVDEYGSMVQPCSLHSIFQNPYYVPFGDITERNYHAGDFITIDGISERIERIVEIDINSFNEKYGSYLSEEQVAREFFVSTGTITNWIRTNKIQPTVTFPFGSRKIHMFSKEDVEDIRVKMNIKEHNDETIKQDFFAFLEERDYSLSYKMPFLTYFIQHMDSSGDANIDEVLDDYIGFYEDRIKRGLVVDRKTCNFI